jgi:hypothetical protein
VRFAAFLLCCFLSASLYSATNLFYGTIRFDTCRQRYVVTWTNPPLASVVEHSFDLTNWHAVLIVSQPVENLNLNKSLEYDATNSSQHLFMRLREIQPIATPTR